MWCSNGGWCGNTQDHKNSGLANFHFPEQCKQLIKWGIPYQEVNKYQKEDAS